MKQEKQKRELFSTHIGMLLACVGSAMGLANIWMFPGRLEEFGGITFLLPYLLFLFGFSCFGLMGEYAFGRTMRKGPVLAFNAVIREKWRDAPAVIRAIGWFPVVALVGILAFYTVIIGWILRYFGLALVNKFQGLDTTAFFEMFAGKMVSVPWTLAALALTAVIVSFGIQKGIERWTTIMMGAFYLVVMVILVRTLTLPNAWVGVRQLITPKWTGLAHIRVWVYALGMAFFTLSLGGAAMVVYGSYMPDNIDIPRTAWQTAGLDFLASVMCALFTIPAAAALGLDRVAGPALLFITVPQIIIKLPAGYVFGVLFFLCVLCASLTSSIVMLEVPVEAVMSKWHLSRKAAAVTIAGFTGVIASALSIDMRWFSVFTNTVAIILFPLAAVLAAFVIFWLYGGHRIRQDINANARYRIGRWYTPYMKYIFVPICFIIVVTGIFLGDL